MESYTVSLEELVSSIMLIRLQRKLRAVTNFKYVESYFECISSKISSYGNSSVTCSFDRESIKCFKRYSKDVYDFWEDYITLKDGVDKSVLKASFNKTYPELLFAMRCEEVIEKSNILIRNIYS